MESKYPNRYARLKAIEAIGPEGVEKLQAGKVFIIGCGALGSLCAMYLAASGVGTLGLADFDTIDATNLQRQLFFTEDTVGASKIEQLADRIRQLNSDTRLNIHKEMITKAKAECIFPDYDFIIDGSDNPSTKLMTAAVCEKAGIPYCIGGVESFAGQCMSWSPGHAGYKDLFGEIAGCTGLLPCSIAGVAGPAAGVVASYQASEAIKFLASAGSMLYDRLLTFDLLTASADILEL
ncbi:MAG: HesA/MoeB/ThiF family protein [Bacteroidales bacterium]|nr:HesA/MoeB/ThiF family protein [Bacteroidales bacterium]